MRGQVSGVRGQTRLACPRISSEVIRIQLLRSFYIYKLAILFLNGQMLNQNSYIINHKSIWLAYWMD